ncbi:unnamed protein product [Arctia plantaginis]|uniref:Uncharacterized protein n=1 Tax=Arctia plantaginis TaxID=874455 RepID=A0A8S1AIE4_ARCPL|nr:unnamed protein product [Arctia plantaginis]
MYVTLVDSLNTITPPLKITIFTLLVIAVPRSAVGYFILNSGFKVFGLDALLLLRMICNLYSNFPSLICASILWDLIDEEVIIIRTRVYEKLIRCTNERMRSELQLILDVIDQRPLNFRLFRAMPLSVKISLSFFLSVL